MGLFGKLFGAGAASEALPENAILIDVRSPEEFASGHIKDAISVPLNRLPSAIGSVASNKSAPVIVYCQSGGRSASARRLMLDMGYQNVINGGGIRSLAGRMNREIL
ncbi:MAG TPA: rhodanese-like domain-containing protein [Noviherbaspirillum sp.]|nr:rhodanese-like domain-containing protein [Noviherbaspirillum sp.]